MLSALRPAAGRLAARRAWQVCMSTGKAGGGAKAPPKPPPAPPARPAPPAPPPPPPPKQLTKKQLRKIARQERRETQAAEEAARIAAGGEPVKSGGSSLPIAIVGAALLAGG